MSESAEAFRAAERKRAWNRYAYECERARLEYEKAMEFWCEAVVDPQHQSATWGWHASTPTELATPKWRR